MSTTPPVVIDTRALCRRFGAVRAVDGVDLRVRRGEVFGFLGPNGSGKSTLLRVLLGLLRPTSGDVRVLGLEIPRDAEKLRPRVGYMTQRFSLYEDLSVEENLEFALEIFGVERRLRKQRLDSALRDGALGAYRATRAMALSGGFKQRLALAASTVHEPELLVLDEPTAGVDPQSRREFWGRLFDLARRGTTVLVSTHYMDEAVRCHRICMLREGRRAALGRPRDLVRALAGRVLDVRADSPEPVLAALADASRVASVTQLGEIVHVLLPPDAPAEAAAEQLRALLDERGLHGAWVEPSQANLEDVFVALLLGERLEGSQQGTAA